MNSLAKCASPTRWARWLALAAAAALLVSACGGGGSDNAADDCEPGETDGDLAFYNWADYIDEELLLAFEEETGVSIDYTVYESNEQMLSRWNPKRPSTTWLCRRTTWLR